MIYTAWKGPKLAIVQLCVWLVAALAMFEHFPPQATLLQTCRRDHRWSLPRAQAHLHTWRLKQQAEMFHLGVAALAAAAFLATFLKKVCAFFAACLAFALTGFKLKQFCAFPAACLASVLMGACMYSCSEHDDSC